MSTRKTAEVAAELRISPRKVTKLANQLGVGMVIGGSAGRRFDQADVDAIKAALRPTPVTPVQPLRRRRRDRSLSAVPSPRARST